MSEGLSKNPKQEVELLQEKLEKITSQLESATEETRTNSLKRDELNSQARNLREQIAALRSTYEEKLEETRRQSSEIKNLKEELDGARQAVSKIRDQLNSMHNPRLRVDEVKQRIEKMEWQIQTSPLKPEDEKRLFEEVRRLEQTLKVLNKRNSMASAMSGKKTLIKDLIEQLKTKAGELTRLREEAVELKTKKSKLLEEHKKLRDNASAYHKAFVKGRESEMRLEAERILVISKLKDIARSTRASRETAIKQEIRKQAKLKLEAGRKLTFEEMKILMEGEEDWLLKLGERSKNRSDER